MVKVQILYILCYVSLISNLRLNTVSSKSQIVIKWTADCDRIHDYWTFSLQFTFTLKNY